MWRPLDQDLSDFLHWHSRYRATGGEPGTKYQVAALCPNGMGFRQCRLQHQPVDNTRDKLKVLLAGAHSDNGIRFRQCACEGPEAPSLDRTLGATSGLR